MEMRISKIDIISGVMEQGMTNNYVSNGRVNSALSHLDLHDSSKLISHSAKSDRLFREIELSAHVGDTGSMSRFYSDEKYGAMTDTNRALAFDNQGLILDEVAIGKPPKLSVSSAASTGLVMEGSRSQKENCAETKKRNTFVKDISLEAQKYSLPDIETTSILVKTVEILTTESKVSDAASDNHPLKISSTIETTNSAPSTTSTTCDSSLRPSASSFDNNYTKDETLLIGEPSENAESTKDSTTGTLKDFDATGPTVAGINENSLAIYSLIQKEGLKSGRCIIMTMVTLTFCMTILLTVLLLLIPATLVDKEEPKFTRNFENTTPTSLRSAMLWTRLKNTQLKEGHTRKLFANTENGSIIINKVKQIVQK